MSVFPGKFDHRLHVIPSRLVAILAEIDEMKGHFRGGLRMTPQAIINLRKSTLVTSAGASTRIEGSQLTDEQVAKIMQGLEISKFSDRDSQEVQGYLETLQNVFDGFEQLPFRESLILSLHQQLLKYSHKDETHRGTYKKKENAVGVLGPDGQVAHILFETTKAFLTAKEMQELVEWATDAFDQKRFHPLLIIANVIVEFLKIHPFEDGNGRLSRILTNVLLLRSGYSFTQYSSHEQIIERRKDEYYLALRTSQQTFSTTHDTIEPWLNFFLSVIHEQAQKSLFLLEEERFEDTLTLKQMEVWKYFLNNHEGTPREIVQLTGIGLDTVRQILNKLLSLKKVKRVGQGRGVRYIKLPS